MIFAFHAYPWLIHRLTYRRHNHRNLHVRGYKEEGTITTAFDMTVMNDHGSLPSGDGRRLDRLPQTGSPVAITSSSSCMINWWSTSIYIDLHGRGHAGDPALEPGAI